MRILTRIFAVVLLTALGFGLLPGLSAKPAQALMPNPPKVLVVYDNPSGQFGKLGLAYAIMLRNLLGHFTTTVDLQAVNTYTTGLINNYGAMFYVGSYFGNPLPAAFLSDAQNTTKTIVWFKNNLSQIAGDWQNPNSAFIGKYGFAFDYMYGLNAQPTANAPNPGFFDTVTYKGMPFLKYYSYDATTNTIFSDPDVGVTHITGAAQQVVPIKNSATNVEIPYIVHSGNFWYVADVPFAYIGPRDRYLVICDVLHDILNSTLSAAPRALVRLEDVSAITTGASMNTLSDYFANTAIPFSIALIPEYRDPLGHYNGGVSETIKLTDSGAAQLRTALTYAVGKGGKILMHGYTHQYNTQPNPYFAVSGEDFEFWNVGTLSQPLDQPVAEDTTNTWATNRVNTGLRQISQAGFGVPFAFEAPHYKASARDYRIFATKFAKTYQRAFYYTADVPTTGDYAVGQFFPYTIDKDYYNQRVLPENLGNIEYAIPLIDPTSTVIYTAQDILTNADYAKVVRDGFGAFFFHPFWLEPDLQGQGTPPVNGLADLQTVINGIKSRGYTFVDASTL
jgi:uncharacterized protein YdaL